MTARRPRASRTTTALPSLYAVSASLLAGGFGLLATAGDAHAQTSADDAATHDASDGAVSDVTDASMAPPIVVEEHVLGGVPMRTGGAPPSHGMCACDLPHAAHAGSLHAAALGIAAVLVSARRRRR